MAAAAKKDVVVRPEGMPTFMDPQTNRGNEEVGAEDLTIPRIGLIQDLSPQRKKSDPEYIEGAEEGMLFNTVSTVLYGEEVPVIPCYFRREFAIWKDRKAGGGFRGAFGDEDTANMALAELEDGDQCEVIETAQHFVLVGHADKWDEAVVSMSKSKMKAHRQLNSLVRMQEGDRFAHIYRMKAIPAQNAAGEAYFNLAFSHMGWVDTQEVYTRANELYEAVKAGKKDVKRDDHQD